MTQRGVDMQFGVTELETGIRAGGVGIAFVLAALLPMRAHGQAVGAAVVGSVFDSVSMEPLANAVVRLVRSDDPQVGQSAVTDAIGRFKFLRVAEGVWQASFFHRTLDSLRLEPALVRLRIVDSTPVVMPLSTPAARTLTMTSCGKKFPVDAGMLVGVVRRANMGAPVADATVEVEWPEWSFVNKRLATTMRRRRARSDSAGQYVLCGAPLETTVRAVSWVGADTTGAIEVAVPGNGYALQDFSIEATVFESPTNDSLGIAAPRVRVRRGRASVQGVITKIDGTPLANAVVRVIGSGSPARSSSNGSFLITDAGAGTQSVEAAAIGFEPVRRAVTLTEAGAAEVSLSLPVRNVLLDTVRVFAGREPSYEVQGIERRWRTGVGTFMDSKSVLDRATVFVTEALRGMPGVQLTPSRRGGQTVFMNDGGGRSCRPNVFVDGVRMDVAGIDDNTLDDLVRPEAVAVLEVYLRQGTVPAEFLNTSNGCGVLAVWTKRGIGNVPVIRPDTQRR